jgi:hypothetical protein
MDEWTRLLLVTWWRFVLSSDLWARKIVLIVLKMLSGNAKDSARKERGNAKAKEV